jgi:hypothetical protein
VFRVARDAAKRVRGNYRAFDCWIQAKVYAIYK